MKSFYIVTETSNIKFHNTQNQTKMLKVINPDHVIGGSFGLKLQEIEEEKISQHFNFSILYSPFQPLFTCTVYFRVCKNWKNTKVKE